MLGSSAISIFVAVAIPNICNLACTCMWLSFNVYLECLVAPSAYLACLTTHTIHNLADVSEFSHKLTLHNCLK